MSGKESTVREEVLLAAARAVVASLTDCLESRELPPQAIASLHVLEAALDNYPDPKGGGANW